MPLFLVAFVTGWVCGAWWERTESPIPTISDKVSSVKDKIHKVFVNAQDRDNSEKKDDDIIEV